MKEYNKLRIKYCKVCPIKECDSCQISHRIEELTIGKKIEEERQRRIAQEKVLLMRQGIADLAKEHGLELIDGGYLTVRYNNKFYSLSTNTRT